MRLSRAFADQQWWAGLLLSSLLSKELSKKKSWICFISPLGSDTSSKLHWINTLWSSEIHLIVLSVFAMKVRQDCLMQVALFWSAVSIPHWVALWCPPQERASTILRADQYDTNMTQMLYKYDKNASQILNTKSQGLIFDSMGLLRAYHVTVTECTILPLATQRFALAKCQNFWHLKGKSESAGSYK